MLHTDPPCQYFLPVRVKDGRHDGANRAAIHTCAGLFEKIRPGAGLNNGANLRLFAKPPFALLQHALGYGNFALTVLCTGRFDIHVKDRRYNFREYGGLIFWGEADVNSATHMNWSVMTTPSAAATCGQLA